ncbi:MAG: hypothetical protein QME12_06505 [Nanoarchaeota archaeon]|nr:hypothetical protein [Nanoarchaeota archaeon]
MSRRRKHKSIANIIEGYILSSKIHDYYELPCKSQEEIIEEEGDYFAVRMQASQALSRDEKIIKGIQKRIVTAVRNSFLGHCFAGYGINDTAVSVSAALQSHSASIFNLRSLDSLLDNTSSKDVRIFSSTMPNGYSRIAARLEEKGAVVYVHKSLLYLSALHMLQPFVKVEGDREWLVDYMQKIADEKAELHF